MRRFKSCVNANEGFMDLAFLARPLIVYICCNEKKIYPGGIMEHYGKEALENVDPGNIVYNAFNEYEQAMNMYMQNKNLVQVKTFIQKELARRAKMFEVNMNEWIEYVTGTHVMRGLNNAISYNLGKIKKYSEIPNGLETFCRGKNDGCESFFEVALGLKVLSSPWGYTGDTGHKWKLYSEKYNVDYNSEYGDADYAITPIFDRIGENMVKKYAPKFAPVEEHIAKNSKFYIYRHGTEPMFSSHQPIDRLVSNYYASDFLKMEPTEASITIENVMRENFYKLEKINTKLPI